MIKSQALSNLYYDLPNHMLNDVEIYETYKIKIINDIKNNNRSFNSIYQIFKNDLDIIMVAVKKNINVLQLIDIKYLDNPYFMMLWNGEFCLQYASNRLKDDKNFALKLIQEKSPDVFKYASDRLKDDDQIVWATIKQNAGLIQYASDTLKNDRELVQLAIQKDPKVLQYAHPNLQEIFKTELIECKSLVEAFLIVAEVKNISIETNELEILKQKTPNQIKDALKIIVLATQKSELDILFKIES